MKKQFLTKILASGLALIMLFGSVACSKSDKTYEYKKESEAIYYLSLIHI